MRVSCERTRIHDQPRPAGFTMTGSAQPYFRGLRGPAVGTVRVKPNCIRREGVTAGERL